MTVYFLDTSALVKRYVVFHEVLWYSLLRGDPVSQMACSATTRER